MIPFAIVRDYHKDDFEAIKNIHEATEINYAFVSVSSKEGS